MNKKFRKGVLNMKEYNIYKTIKDLAENKISKSRAIVILGYSNVHINRLLKKYKLDGKIAFSHGNKNRKPATTTSNEIKNKIIKLYEQKYFNFNITHFNEFLNNFENIKVSIPTVTKILKDAFILSPKAHKKTKKDLIQLIEKKQVESKSKKVIYNLKNAHVFLQRYQSHPTRPRMKYAGELIQMDASKHDWFCNGTYAHLHIAIDDHSGKILSAFFDKEETLKAYYQITYDMIVNYGIPYSILTDKRTVFEYKNKSNKSIENDTFTQYGYACHRLGIDLKTTSIPQAKGRVERAFSTLQSRLVNELRINNINNIESANMFLPQFIEAFNNKFSTDINNTLNAFQNQDNIDELNLILSVINTRKVDRGNCIRFNNKYYGIFDNKNNRVYPKYNSNVLVIKTFDNKLFASIDDYIFSLEKIETHLNISKNFDDVVDVKVKKKYIPPISHLWKRESFIKYLEKNNKIENYINYI